MSDTDHTPQMHVNNHQEHAENTPHEAANAESENPQHDPQLQVQENSNENAARSEATQTLHDTHSNPTSSPIEHPPLGAAAIENDPALAPTNLRTLHPHGDLTVDNRPDDVKEQERRAVEENVNKTPTENKPEVFYVTNYSGAILAHSRNPVPVGGSMFMEAAEKDHYVKLYGDNLKVEKVDDAWHKNMQEDRQRKTEAAQAELEKFETQRREEYEVAVKKHEEEMKNNPPAPQLASTLAEPELNTPALSAQHTASTSIDNSQHVSNVVGTHPSGDLAGNPRMPITVFPAGTMVPDELRNQPMVRQFMPADAEKANPIDPVNDPARNRDEQENKHEHDEHSHEYDQK